MRIALCGNKNTYKSTLLKNILLSSPDIKIESITSGLLHLVSVAIGAMTFEPKDSIVNQLESGSISKDGPLALNKMKFRDGTVRDMFQKLGDECKSQLGKYVWLNSLCERIGNHSKVIVDDVRFDYEMKFLYDQGFDIVYVHRENSDGLHETEKVEENINRFKSSMGVGVVSMTLNHDNGIEENTKLLLEYLEHKAAVSFI